MCRRVRHDWCDCTHAYTVYVSTLLSQFAPPSLSPTVSLSPFSRSATLSLAAWLPCRQRQPDCTPTSRVRSCSHHLVLLILGTSSKGSSWPSSCCSQKPWILSLLSFPIPYSAHLSGHPGADSTFKSIQNLFSPLACSPRWITATSSLCSHAIPIVRYQPSSQRHPLQKLRYNWHITLYLFQMHAIMIWYLYILPNDHNKSRKHLSP